MNAEIESQVHDVLLGVLNERRAQVDRWGVQSHPDGTGRTEDRDRADRQRDRCEHAFRLGTGSWRYILSEEFFEALAETDPTELYNELVQVAAVAVAWAEDIKRREATK